MEAVEKAEVFTPDLAILDLGMPIMNGVRQSARDSERQSPASDAPVSVQEVSHQLADAARDAGFRGGHQKSWPRDRGGR